MNVTLVLDGQAYDVDVEAGDEERTYRVRVGGEPFEVAVQPDGDAVDCRVDELDHEIVRKGRSLIVDGEPVDVGVRELAQASMGAGTAAGGEVTPPMPGTIVEVLVEEGDEVEAGEVILVLEAMKMQNDITAPGDATVGTVHVAEGDAVEADDVLVELEPV